MRQKCFGLVVAIPALLFLACLHIEFARVYLPVFRTHLQLCRHLLRSVLTRFKQPMVSSPRSERKTRKCSCEEKNRTAARGRCLGLKPPLSQTTMKARIGHPRRDQTPWCSPSCSILARSVLLQFLLHFAIASRNNKPTKHQGHQSPQHGFSGTRVVTAIEGVIRSPARARLPDAEQTRAKTDQVRYTHLGILQRSFNTARLHRRETNRMSMSSTYHGPLLENNACKGPHRGEAIFNCRWMAQVSISRPKTMAASRRCSITRTSLRTW